MSPCTYLAVEKKEAEQYGDVILEVEYDPTINPKMNNYQKDSWQLRVYEPIYINNIKITLSHRFDTNRNFYCNNVFKNYF